MSARLLILAAVAAVFALRVDRPPQADVTGALRVVDADTFDVGDARIRLFGVDAPEKHQTCLDSGGEEWDCGLWAIEEARARWEGRPAACDVVDTDRYGRLVARCAVGGQDVGAALVAGGLALAYREYSADYVVQEAAARAAGAGVWQGDFRMPKDYRRDPDGQITDVVLMSAPEGCDVKGNISEAGRIFHVPGSPHYDRTRIEPADGERWFCSAAEAEAAGWRAPR